MATATGSVSSLVLALSWMTTGFHLAQSTDQAEGGHVPCHVEKTGGK
jgi:hypothetical protein